MKATAKHDKLVSKVVFIMLLLVFSLVIGCSTRVGYDTAKQNFAAADSININTASAKEIEKLPGIGRKTADAIVAFREENGPFCRPEHLLLIRGVSESRFAELRQCIRTE